MKVFLQTRAEIQGWISVPLVLQATSELTEQFGKGALFLLLLRTLLLVLRKKICKGPHIPRLVDLAALLVDLGGDFNLVRSLEVQVEGRESPVDLPALTGKLVGQVLVEHLLVQFRDVVYRLLAFLLHLLALKLSKNIITLKCCCDLKCVGLILWYLAMGKALESHVQVWLCFDILLIQFLCIHLILPQNLILCPQIPGITGHSGKR